MINIFCFLVWDLIVLDILCEIVDVSMIIVFGFFIELFNLDDMVVYIFVL